MCERSVAGTNYKIIRLILMFFVFVLPSEDFQTCKLGRAGRACGPDTSPITQPINVLMLFCLLCLPREDQRSRGGFCHMTRLTHDPSTPLLCDAERDRGDVFGGLGGAGGRSDVFMFFPGSSWTLPAPPHPRRAAPYTLWPANCSARGRKHSRIHISCVPHTSDITS